jgi:hypothetical protein
LGVYAKQNNMQVTPISINNIISVLVILILLCLALLLLHFDFRNMRM